MNLLLPRCSFIWPISGFQKQYRILFSLKTALILPRQVLHCMILLWAMVIISKNNLSWDVSPSNIYSWVLLLIGSIGHCFNCEREKFFSWGKGIHGNTFLGVVQALFGEWEGTEHAQFSPFVYFSVSLPYLSSRTFHSVSLWGRLFISWAHLKVGRIKVGIRRINSEGSY